MAPSKLLEELASLFRELENLKRANMLHKLDECCNEFKEIKARLEKLELIVAELKKNRQNQPPEPEKEGSASNYEFNGDHRLDPSQGDLIRGAFHWAEKGKVKGVTNENLAATLNLTEYQVRAAKAHLSGKLAQKSRRKIPTLKQTREWLQKLDIAS